MRVVVTEADEPIGRSVIQQLVVTGHTVIGIHRDGVGAQWMSDAGATPTTANLRDLTELQRALDGADAVVNLVASVPTLPSTQARAAPTHDHRLVDTTPTLVDAARRVGVRRFIQQSSTLCYRDSGSRWIEEDTSVSPAVPAMARTVAAEAVVLGSTSADRCGIVLRMAELYGPGETSRPLVDALRRRSAPIVGAGRNYVSNLHLHDAGTAVVAALAIPAGVYNVADDRPVSSAARLVLQSEALSAPRPRHITPVVARVLVGKGARLLATSHRVSNRTFRQITDWRPRYPWLGDGWPTVVASSA